MKALKDLLLVTESKLLVFKRSEFSGPSVKELNNMNSSFDLSVQVLNRNIGDLVQKRTRKGRSFFACSKYPACEYALWDRPIPKKCPTCSAPFLIEKVSKQTGRSVQCRNEDCGYREAG